MSSEPSAVIGADWPEDGLSGVDLAALSPKCWLECQNSSKHVSLLWVMVRFRLRRPQVRAENPFQHFMAWLDDRGSDISGFQELKWDKYLWLQLVGANSISDIA